MIGIELTRSASNPSPSRATALILNPSLHVSYGTLQRWSEEQAEDFSIAVHGQEFAKTLGALLAPRTVQVVPLWPTARASRPLLAPWQSYASLIRRFGVIVVLCATDDEVTTGHTVYRILGEMLFSDRIVLIGPRLMRVWPDGHGVLSRKRARELITLVGMMGMGLGMTAVALAALALQEALSRMRLWR